MHTSYTFLSKPYRQCPNLHLTYLRRAFDKATVKLEHREFMLDSEVQPVENEDAVDFWLKNPT